jgi:hypothetical protein
VIPNHHEGKRLLLLRGGCDGEKREEKEEGKPSVNYNFF